MDLSAVLREVVALSQSAADAAGVKVHLEAGDVLSKVMADPEQMKQLFGNLVLNAIQAMPNGGTLTVRGKVISDFGSRISDSAIRPASAGQSAIVIEVEDTGSGIPEEDLPHIFEPFYTTRTKGTGLGLAICRQIVEAHGGTMRVRRTGPEGTAIEVILPREASADG
jgi:signal transduction histidine kinase